jgi:peptidyl-prolyl cis-trans isomerase B (cyclophilin B)
MKRIGATILAIIMIGAIIMQTGCQQNTPAEAENPAPAETPAAETPAAETPAGEPAPAQESVPIELPEDALAPINETNPIVMLEIDGGGKIYIELLPEYAPNTVNNYISLVKSGLYDGTIFHRIVPDFMIQGGDPDGIGTGGPGYAIKGEFVNNGFEQNNISHSRGIVSMARAGDPDSAGSQFFICVADVGFLNGQYAAFGRVLGGMEVADEIVMGPAQNERATEPRTIVKATVDTRGVDYPEPEKIAE